MQSHLQQSQQQLQQNYSQNTTDGNVFSSFLQMQQVKLCRFASCCVSIFRCGFLRFLLFDFLYVVFTCCVPLLCCEIAANYFLKIAVCIA